jgi:hypothetical protein
MVPKPGRKGHPAAGENQDYPNHEISHDPVYNPYSVRTITTIVMTMPPKTVITAPAAAARIVTFAALLIMTPFSDCRLPRHAQALMPRTRRRETL